MRGPCSPTDGPTIGYYCEEPDGTPVATPISTDGAGTRLVQAPLHRCGDNTPICEGDQVSGCISDTDGEPTSYGPLPDAPPLNHVHGGSPLISRVRVNRVTLPVLPYSAAKHPDQLIDFVIDGGEGDDIPVPYNPATGRFTFPPATEMPTPLTAGCGIDINEDNEIEVVTDYGVASDSDALLGNATVLTAGSGRVTRLLVQPVIDNLSCREQFIFANVVAGFGFSPVTPDAQVRYGVLQNGVVLQEFQSQPFTAGWQRKDSYLYVPVTPEAPGGFQDEHYELFAEAVNPGDQFIWVDADLGVDKWYGK